mmetsp:Transcript_50502/g.152126  ORF Transcript_50502/g.152126 Transcript_50502/m.152126 type:complete len:209 (-) Transcript_50502:408-1034(-)
MIHVSRRYLIAAHQGHTPERCGAARQFRCRSRGDSRRGRGMRLLLGALAPPPLLPLRTALFLQHLDQILVDQAVHDGQHPRRRFQQRTDEGRSGAQCRALERHDDPVGLSHILGGVVRLQSFRGDEHVAVDGGNIQSVGLALLIVLPPHVKFDVVPPAFPQPSSVITTHGAAPDHGYHWLAAASRSLLLRGGGRRRWRQFRSFFCRFR